jgi:hypothetical protein
MLLLTARAFHLILNVIDFVRFSQMHAKNAYFLEGRNIATNSRKCSGNAIQYA